MPYINMGGGGGGGEGGKEKGGGSGFSDNMSLNIDWVGAGGLHLHTNRCTYGRRRIGRRLCW